MSDLPARVASVMPEVLEDLRRLCAIPSVAFPGYPAEPVLEAATFTADVLRRSGVRDARLLDIPGGYPAVTGNIPGPPGTPTLLLYAHYDVQPAPREGWRSDPWTPVTRDGRIYGRGAADDKSGVAIHAGTVRVFEGRPPVGLRFLIEGEEETVSHLGDAVEADPSLAACDAFLVADMGNLAVGSPALTTSLRGEAACTVVVRTLDHPVHSGQFGGPAPDALVALVRMLATLHDERGEVAVPGLASFAWEGGDVPEPVYRETAGLLGGVDLLGEGSLGSRLWSKPSVTVIGLDAPAVREAANVLIHEATAKVSLRTVPGSDSERELDLLMNHLRAVVPWGAHAEVRRVKAGQPFRCPTGGPVHFAARDSMAAAFGAQVSEVGSGATIPLLETLRSAVPDAEFILWGAEDLESSGIHGPNESVDPGEIERLILSQAYLMQGLGEEVRRDPGR